MRVDRQLDSWVQRKGIRPWEFVLFYCRKKVGTLHHCSLRNSQKSLSFLTEWWKNDNQRKLWQRISIFYASLDGATRSAFFPPSKEKVFEFFSPGTRFSVPANFLEHVASIIFSSRAYKSAPRSTPRVFTTDETKIRFFRRAVIFRKLRGDKPFQSCPANLTL